MKFEEFEYNLSYDYDINELAKHWVNDGHILVPMLIEILKRHEKEIKDLNKEIKNLKEKYEKNRSPSQD